MKNKMVSIVDASGRVTTKRLKLNEQQAHEARQQIRSHGLSAQLVPVHGTPSEYEVQEIPVRYGGRRRTERGIEDNMVRDYNPVHEQLPNNPFANLKLS